MISLRSARPSLEKPRTSRKSKRLCWRLNLGRKKSSSVKKTLPIESRRKAWAPGSVIWKGRLGKKGNCLRGARPSLEKPRTSRRSRRLRWRLNLGRKKEGERGGEQQRHDLTRKRHPPPPPPLFKGRWPAAGKKHGCS